MQTIYYSRKVSQICLKPQKFLFENLTTKQTTLFACNRCGLLR